jgi:hypothetical protein
MFEVESMMRKIFINRACDDLNQGRIGGGAFIGGIFDWPKANDGEKLTLIASIPVEMIGYLDRNKFVSVFSYYSKNDYFVDKISYHGNKDELDYIVTNQTTRVFVHEKGSLLQEGCLIKPMLIEIDKQDEIECFQGSGFGMPPGFIQNENISFENGFFVLQLYSGDFPEPHRDIFGLTDSIGYLYLDINMKNGVFFTQVS